MVTLNSADSALKSFYLEALNDSLDNKTNPFLAKIEKTSKNVAGKDVRVAVRTGFNGGISAGTEDGALPACGDAEYLQFTGTLKNLYGTIEISDKALRASARDEGAFVNLLNDEMRSLVDSASYNFGRMLFSRQDGLVAVVDNVVSNKIIVDNVTAFKEGMYIDVYNTSGAKYTAQRVKVTFVDRESTALHVEGDVSKVTASDQIYLHGSKGNEISGLESVFTDETLYGVDRTNPYMKPYVYNDVGAISENTLQMALDCIEEASGGKVNFIVCSWGVRRALLEYYKSKQTTMPTMEIEGGFKALSFNGIPVVVDRFCPAGTMYLLNTDDFKLCQLCDWQWLESEDGKILKQVPGKAVYTATLVKYAELICERPCAQGKLSGIEEY